MTFMHMNLKKAFTHYYAYYIPEILVRKGKQL